VQFDIDPREILLDVVGMEETLISDVVAKLERTRWQEHVAQTREQLNVVHQEEARLEALLDRMRGNFGAPTRQGYPADVVNASQAASSAGPAPAAAAAADAAAEFTRLARLAEQTPTEINHKLTRMQMALRDAHGGLDPVLTLRIGKEIDRLKKTR